MFKLCLGLLLVVKVSYQQSPDSNTILDTDLQIRNKQVNVYWNIPTFQCDYHKLNFTGLAEKYDIIMNENDRFRGDEIVILYDPGNFPAILKNVSESVYRNGGVPQEGNLTDHLEMFEQIVEELIPREDFSGIGVIDFESWRPVYRQNFGKLAEYQQLSVSIEEKRHPEWPKDWLTKEATKRFEYAAKQFMEETLSKAKCLRPNATWGYYAYPYCFNMSPNHMKQKCPTQVMAENDRLGWLFNRTDNFHPSVYIEDVRLNVDEKVQMMQGRIDEAHRIVKHMKRKENAPQIIPYFWYNYHDTKKFVTKEDLFTTFTVLANSAIDGLVIWGSSNDVNTKSKCLQLYEYIDNTMGPLLYHIFQNI